MSPEPTLTNSAHKTRNESAVAQASSKTRSYRREEFLDSKRLVEHDRADRSCTRPHVLVGKRRHQDHRRPPFRFSQELHEREPAATRHAHIGQDQVDSFSPTAVP